MRECGIGAVIALLVACGGATGERDRRAGGVEAVAEPEPVAEPEAIEAVRGCSVDVVSAQEALFTVGNRWGYLEFSGWHSESHEYFWAEETIVAARRVDRSRRVAVVQRRVRSFFEESGAVTQSRFTRLGRGAATWRVDCLDAGPTASRAQFEDAIRRCGRVEVPRRASGPRALCTPSGCGGFLGADHSNRGNWPHSVALWPGVGIAAWSLGSYSTETGDGLTEHRALVSFDLTTSAGTLGAHGPEPRGFARVRALVHRLARADDLAGLRPLLSERVQFSLNDEHRVRASAVEAWAADGGLAMRALADVTSGECGRLGAHVVCPAAEAERMAGIRGCRSPRRPTEPRALFVRSQGRWRLASLLLGGEDDLFMVPSSRSDPPLPLSLRARFDR